MKFNETTVRTFATFRVTGDALVPSDITEIFCIKPTISYEKGEIYFTGKKSGELTGRTGLWYFNTDTIVRSNKLIDHILFIVAILAPDTTLSGAVMSPPSLANPMALSRFLFRLGRLRNLMVNTNLKASMTLFWHGRLGSKSPTVPRGISAILRLVPIDIEIDFDVEENPQFAKAT